LTGCAGFIGSTLLDRLLADGHRVIGVDDFNDFYDPKRKRSNISSALKNENFLLIEKNILDLSVPDISSLITNHQSPITLIHLAARAGIRPSLEAPELYERVNIGGTLRLLELMKSLKIRRMIFGSSSSVYGNATVPFSENVECFPLSPYGVTKRAAELFCQTYARHYDMRIACLRFFTVYGPRNRPDMAAYKFLDAIIHERPIAVYGKNTMRDFTYVEDIVDGISMTLKELTTGNLSDFSIMNLGNSKPVSVLSFVRNLERVTGKKAVLKSQSLPSGEMLKTHANISRAKHLLNWSPKTPLPAGLTKLWQWYQSSVMSEQP
jgi:UDP-glucuronate 4-epimerase